MNVNANNVLGGINMKNDMSSNGSTINFASKATAMSSQTMVNPTKSTVNKNMLGH